jgi:membrane protease YdiL (CAAX protease family)
MTVPTPPPVLEEDIPSRHPGYPLVWVGVFVTLAFMAFGAYASLSNPGPVVEERAKLDRELRKLETEFSLAVARHSGKRREAAKELLGVAQQKLGNLDLQTKGAAYVRDRALLILRMVAEPDQTHDCSSLSTATDDITETELRAETAKDREQINRALCALAHQAQGEELEEARQILSQHSSPWPLGLALSEAERRLGVKESETGPIWLAFLMVGGVGVGAVLWVAYVALRLTGSLAPVGLTVRGATQENLVADSLGARFFAYLAIFAIAPLGIVQLLRPVLGDENLARILATAIVAPVVILVVAMPLLGVRISFARLLGLGPNLARNVVWGVAGWLANLPALLVLLIVTVFLSKWLPSGSHPLETELDSLGGILWAAVAAGVIAPIVEEITFRGCLFQGLALRLRSPVVAALLSSLAFASLHPQGPASWLVLGWIGAMGCFLTYQTGSLIPAIVMHSLHNLSIIVVAVSTKNSFGL